MGLLSEVISVAKRLVDAGYPESTAMKIATGELPMDQISRMARAKEQGFTEKAYHSGKDASGKIYDGSYEPTGRGIIDVDPEDGSNMFASGGSPFVSQSYTGSMRQSPTSYPLLVNTKNFEKTNAEGQMWNDIDSPYVYAPNGELVRSDFTVSLGNGVKGKEPLYEKEVLDTNRLARGAKERGASGVVIDNVRDIGANSLRMYDAIKRSGLDQDEWNKLYGDQGGQVLAINDGTKARSLLSAAFDPDMKGSSNLLASAPTATAGAGILGLAAMSSSDDADAGVLGKAKGLLMDTPSRMARAKEQGFDVDTPVYHGTSEDFDSFDPDRAIGTQFWSTTNKAEIESGDVGAQGSGVIKEMYHKIKNPAGWEEYDKFGIDELISRGYDGLKLPDGNGNYTYTAFDPSQYRSVDAAFDPAKTGSSNLLASNPAATAGAGILGLGAAAQSNDTYADYSPSNLARLQSDDVGSIEAPQSMAAANIAGLMGSVNKVGYDDPLLGMVASQLPSELMNKIAYNDKRGLLDYAKAYAGLLGF